MVVGRPPAYPAGMRTSALAPIVVAAALLLTLAGCGDEATPPASDDSSQTDTDTDTPATDDGTSDLVPVFVDAPDTSAATVTFSGSTIDPAETTIHSGDVVTFTSGDGGTYGLVINNLDSVTVANGLNEYYQFNDAGKYYVSDLVTESSAVITVE